MSEVRTIRNAVALGAALREAREARQVSQSTVASETSTSTRYISEIESGHSKKTLDILFSLLRNNGLELQVVESTR